MSCAKSMASGTFSWPLVLSRAGYLSDPQVHQTLAVAQDNSLSHLLAGSALVLLAVGGRGQDGEAQLHHVRKVRKMKLV